MNTIRCLIVIPLISLFVLSCVNRKMTGNIYDIFPESIDLHAGREVAIKGYLSTIGRMTIMDSIVIVQSYNSTHNFYAYNINTGTLVNKLVAYGRSNNESLWANMQNPYKDNFVMYDISKSVLGSIPLARIGDSAVIFDRIVVQKESSFIYNPDVNMISGGRFLFKGHDITKNTVFKITDKDFNTLYDFGEVDEVESKDKITPELIHMTQQGNIVTNPDGTHFAYTSMCGDMIRFFDCSREDHEPVEMAAYQYNIPKFTVVDRSGLKGAAMSESNVVGVIASAFGEDKFYMLHQSKTILDDAQKRSGNTVLVFDLSGKPLYMYKLDKDVRFISYSRKTGSLIGLSVNERDEDVFIEFKLV